MNTNELAARLARMPHFEDLDGSELENLAAAMEVIDAADGEVLIKEGARADGCYCLLEGAVRVTHDHETGATHRSDLQPGELFGLIGLLGHGRRTASCVAVGPTRCAWLRAEPFNLLHEGSPALALHFQKLVARQLARDTRALNEALVAAMTRKEAPSGEGDGGLSSDFHLTARG